MSLTNQPDPEARQRVVAQDLANVMHPIVQTGRSSRTRWW